MRKISLLQRTMFAAQALIPFTANPAFADDFRKLPGKEIKRLISGKVVTDDVHYSDRFKSGAPRNRAAEVHRTLAIRQSATALPAEAPRPSLRDG